MQLKNKKLMEDVKNVGLKLIKSQNNFKMLSKNINSQI